MADRPVQPQLGRRVKRLRTRADLTLHDLATRSGVSVSALSKIENGQSNASFDTVLKMARGLGVLFDNLIHEAGSCAPENLARLVVTRSGEAEEVPTTIYTYRAYGTAMRQRRLMPLEIEVKTREVPDSVDWSTHGGEEFILVLEGQIELHTEHYAPQRLCIGDTAYFDSLMRHAFVAVGKETARLLSVSLADENRVQSAVADGHSTRSPLRQRADGVQ